MSSQIPDAPHTAAHVKADTTSLGDLLGEVTRDLSTLIRQEIELAKAELKQSGTRAGKGGGMLAGAGVAGHFVLLFLSIALWYALGELMGLGWSAVVVAATRTSSPRSSHPWDARNSKPSKACPKPSKQPGKSPPPSNRTETTDE